MIKYSCIYGRFYKAFYIKWLELAHSLAADDDAWVLGCSVLWGLFFILSISFVSLFYVTESWRESSPIQQQKCYCCLELEPSEGLVLVELSKENTSCSNCVYL